jgi:hypothetical protein
MNRLGLGTIVAGKRLHLTPGALADLGSHQLRNNPQFKEMGDQLREALRGTGKAATGALLEDRVEALADHADHLPARTARLRDQPENPAPPAEAPAPPVFEVRGLGRSPRDGTGRGGGGEEPRSSHDTPEDKPRPPRKPDDIAEGKDPLRSTLEAGASVDVGVPLGTACAQWTRFQDFGKLFREGFEEDTDEEPYEDEDEERATVGGSRR